MPPRHENTQYNTGNILDNDNMKKTQTLRPRPARRPRLVSFKTLKKYYNKRLEENTVTLMDVLQNSDSLVNFRNFLSAEYSEENLDFWVHCEVYRKTKANKRKKIANTIYNAFIKRNSPREINLDYCIKQKIEKQLSYPQSDLFLQAQTQIYQLMNLGPFQRYMAKQTSC